MVGVVEVKPKHGFKKKNPSCRLKSPREGMTPRGMGSHHE
jgi:hypothetical protein